MSLNGTTLSGAITASQTDIRLASGTGVVAGKVIQIDSERMLVQDATTPTIPKVLRGQGGSLQVAHATGALVAIGLPSDFQPFAPMAPTRTPSPSPRLYTYGAAGAIDKAPGVHELNTGAASAMTIANPTLAEEGMELDVVAATAHAYTLGGAFNAGGGGADLLTFGGAVGDSARLIARNEKWLAVNLTGVTIS